MSKNQHIGFQAVRYTWTPVYYIIFRGVAVTLYIYLLKQSSMILNNQQLQLVASGLSNVEHLWLENKLGICGGKHVWHWFMLFNDNSLMFHHSYSQNNGKTMRSYKQGQRAERILIRLTSTNL